MTLPPEVLQKAFKRCLELAQRAATEDEVPVGAVILQKQTDGAFVQVGEGYNQREKKQNPLSHAECEAILDATQRLKSWRLTECVLVVSLEPCPMCLAACQQGRIESLYYAAHDPKGGALSLGYDLHQNVKTNHRFEVRQMDYPEAGEILSQFFQKKRNRSNL